jgi:hypothetical protein
VEGRHNDDEFKPRAKMSSLAPRRSGQGGRNTALQGFLFEAARSSSEHLLKKGELEPPAETIEAAALTDEAPAAVVEEAPAAEDAVVEEPLKSQAPKPSSAEPVAEPEAVAGEPGEDDHAGEGAVENDEIAAAAQPDPAAALTDALSKAGEAIAAATPEPVEEPASPLADPAALGAALKSITLPEGATLAKGMYEVSRFADLLCSFACVQRGLAWEAESEGDASPIPEELANAIADLGGILVRMAQEEIAELVASLKRPEGVEVVEIIYAGEGIEAAQQIVDLVKADETLMAAAEERLAKLAPLLRPRSRLRRSRREGGNDELAARMPRSSGSRRRSAMPLRPSKI